MKFAVFTVGMPEYTPEEAISELREIGYDGVEWRVVDQNASADGKPGFWAGNRCTIPLSGFEAEAPRIRTLVEDAGLAMPNVGSYVTCADLDAVEQAMRGTVALGAPALRVNVGGYNGEPGYRERRERARAQYREVAALARQYGVRALIEMHHNSLTPSASSAASFLDGLDPRDVGVIHDAGNMVYEGYEQYQLGLEVLGPYLGHVHLKNSRWQSVSGREPGAATSQAGWAPMQDGAVDFLKLFAALRSVGYDGWLSFEDFSTERPTAERLRENLAFIRGLLA